jgi:iron complex outermembrane receptor protein
MRLAAVLQGRLDMGRYGSLDLGASDYIELHHRMKSKPGDPEIDLLHDYNSTEFKSKAAATASWTRGQWVTSLHVQYSGTSVNSNGSGTVAPFVTWNASERYSFGGQGAYLQLTANNLLDRHPPADGGIGWPYYNVLNFDGFGRSVFVEFGMHFGGGEPKS